MPLSESILNEIERCVINCQPKDCLKRIKSLPKEEVSDLRPLTLKAKPSVLSWNEQWEFKNGKPPSQKNNPLQIKLRNHSSYEDFESCYSYLAFATYTLSEIRKMPRDLHWNLGRDDVFELLAWLRPAWLQAIAKEQASVTLRYTVIKRFINKGIIEKAPNEGYATALIALPSSFYFKTAKEDFAAYLDENPDILTEDIWLLFQHDGTSDTNLNGTEKYGQDPWGKLFLSKSQTGEIDRQRLLKACCEALARDFVQMRSGWFSRFHERLEPTTDEKALLIDEYYLLLGSTIGPTVTFALKQLKELQKAGRLESDRLLNEIPPSLGASKTVTLNLALDLVFNIAKAEPSKVELCALAASQALMPEAQAGQKKVLRIFNLLKNTIPESISGELALYAENFAPSLTQDFEKFLDPQDVEVTATDFEEETVEIEPILSDSNRIPECTSLEDWIYLGTEIVEGTRNVAKVEQWLRGFGIYVIGAEKSAREAAAPLLKRVRQNAGRDFHLPIQMLFDLVQSIECQQPIDRTDWLADKPVKIGVFQGKDHFREPPEDLMALFLQMRFRELRDKPRQGVPFKNLSFPTHYPYWIDPAILVRRLNEYENENRTPDLTDFVLALARLAPEGRDAASEQALHLTSEHGRILCYALSGVAKGEMTIPAAWVTAGRTYSPDRGLTELAHLDLPAGPGISQPPRYTFEASKEKKTGQHETWYSYSWRVQITPERTSDIPLHYIYSSAISRSDALEKGYSWMNDTPSLINWKLSMTPNDQSGIYYKALRPLMLNVQYTDVGSQAYRCYVEDMIHSHAEFAKATTTAWALSIYSADRTCRDLAQEAFLTAFKANRFHREHAIEAFGFMFKSGVIMLSRIHPILSTTARVDQLAGLELTSVLLHAAESIETEILAQFGKFLEVCYEVLLLNKQKLSDRIGSNFLQGISQKGKADKAAKRIQALTFKALRSTGDPKGIYSYLSTTLNVQLPFRSQPAVDLILS